MAKKIILKVGRSAPRKTRKTCKMKPGLRVQTSRKKEIQAKIKTREAKNWQ